MINLREAYRTGRRYYRNYVASRPYQIKFFNTQSLGPCDPDRWLYQFIAQRGYLEKHPKKTLSIFGVNGDKVAIDINCSDYKIFYTTENVHVPESHWQKYENLLLDKKSIDLSLGFDYITHDKYLRFPLWLMYMFKPDDNYETIKKTCNDLNKHYINMEERVRFCSFLCRYDYFGTRKIIYNQISKIGHIDCDSLFMHNNDDLKEKFFDNKLEYLKSYRFNLCPENTDYKGYVTEKIFESVYSGCIPIYWGSENNPEPEILNQDAVFFLKEDSDNLSLISEVKTLCENPKLYREFAEQNRLTYNAHEIVYDFFRKLEDKLQKLFR